MGWKMWISDRCKMSGNPAEVEEGGCCVWWHCCGWLSVHENWIFLFHPPLMGVDSKVSLNFHGILLFLCNLQALLILHFIAPQNFGFSDIFRVSFPLNNHALRTLQPLYSSWWIMSTQSTRNSAQNSWLLPGTAILGGQTAPEWQNWVLHYFCVLVRPHDLSLLGLWRQCFPVNLVQQSFQNWLWSI